MNRNTMMPRATPEGALIPFFGEFALSADSRCTCAAKQSRKTAYHGGDASLQFACPSLSPCINMD